MSTSDQKGLEAYSFNIKTDIDKRLLKACEKICNEYKNTGTVVKASIDALVAVYASTGIKFDSILHTCMEEIAAINVTQFPGHAGNKLWHQMAVATNETIVGDLVIDLEKLTVTGKMTETFPMTLHLSYGFINAVKDHPKRFCGVLLHELGHPFNFFLGMGDYVWSNYMLTDGVDILLGNKPNVRKIAILDHSTFVKQIKDPAQQMAFLNDRTVEGVRNVVLSNLRTLPRSHLFHNTTLEYRHDEQLADVLPTRLGYAKHLAEYLVEMDRNFGTIDTISNKPYWTMEVVKAAFFIPMFIPVGVVLAFVDMGGDVYDRSENRIRRMRQDLVAQLRNTNNFHRKEQLTEDWEVLEKLEREYKTRGSVMQAFMYFFNRKSRRTQQMDVHEKTLEGLLNNDMHIQAHRLARLAK